MLASKVESFSSTRREVSVCNYLLGFTRRIFSMFLIYIAYLVLGSLLFVTLELAEEEKSRYESKKDIEKAKGIY